MTSRFMIFDDILAEASNLKSDKKKDLFEFRNVKTLKILKIGKDFLKSKFLFNIFVVFYCSERFVRLCRKDLFEIFGKLKTQGLTKGGFIKVFKHY